MRLKIDDLGAVGIIVDDWSFEKSFKPKTIVTDYRNWRTYISRRAVPKHIELTDSYYWKPILKPFGCGSGDAFTRIKVGNNTLIAVEEDEFELIAGDNVIIEADTESKTITISAEGEEQVQSNWNESNPNSKAYIQNKPTIPSAVVVDTDMSETSTNPVQNNTITNKFKEYYNKNEVYNKNQVYPKDEVWNKDEAYSKDEVFSKNETYSRENLYTQEQIDNIVSRTPETDVIIVDITDVVAVEMTPDEVMEHSYFNADGEITDDDDRYSIKVYSVEQGLTYYFSAKRKITNTLVCVAWYDSNGDWISTEPYKGSMSEAVEFVKQPVTAPENAAYLYLNVKNDTGVGSVYEYDDASKADIAAALEISVPNIIDPETGKSSRSNKLFRVPGPYNTTFSEWAWDGESWVMLANKDYGLDSKPIIDSDNVVSGDGILKFGVQVLGNKIILENYTENHNASGHNVIPYEGTDLLFVPIPPNAAFLSVSGAVPDGYNIRYCFFDTVEIAELTNDHYISARPYPGQQDVAVPAGAKSVTLQLRRSWAVEGNYDIEVKMKSSAEIKADIDYNAVPHNLTEIAPVEVTDGKLVSVDGNINDVNTGRIYEYNIAGIDKDLYLSGFLAATGSHIAFALYYNGNTLIGIDNHLHTPGEDTKLNRVKLNVPDGATRLLVNGSTIFANDNKLEMAEDSSDIDTQYSAKAKSDAFKGVIVYNELDFGYIESKYINTSGTVANSENAKYSFPIKMLKGDCVTVDSCGSGMAIISRTDKQGLSYTPVSNFAIGYTRYSYVAPEDCYVAICGRKDMKVSLTRFNPAIRTLLSGKTEVTPTVLNAKWIDTRNGGVIIDSTSGDWNVYEYSNVDSNDIYLFKGGSVVNGTSAIIHFYDENDNLINHFLEGSSNRAFNWNDVFVEIPDNTATIRINAHKNFATKLCKASITDLITPGESDDEQGGLPSYYKEYMEQRNKDVIDAFLYSSPLSTSFCFATDLHYPINPNLGKLAADILRKTPMEGFVCGGDIPNNSNNYGADVTPAEALRRTIAEYNKDLSYIRGTGKSLITIRGNHDFAINRQYGAGSTDAVYVDWKAARNIIMNCNQDIVTNNDDDKACYFYKDYPDAKTRYIFLDTTDNNGNDGQNSKSPAVTDAQMSWILDNAVMTCPQDFNIVFISHIYIQRILGTADRYSDYDNFDSLRSMMDAIQNKKSVVINGVPYDFTQFNPSILCHVAGHNHRDTVVFIDGFWSFTVAANYRSNELPKSPIYQQFPIATPYVSNGEGTVYENLVDAIFVNGEDNVKVFRHGAGYDRIFRQGQTNVNVGSSVQLTSVLNSNDVQWWCHDSIGRTTVDGVMIYNNNFATINSSGVLTAIAQGYVTVAAFSRSKNTVEYIGVKVG